MLRGFDRIHSPSSLCCSVLPLRHPSSGCTLTDFSTVSWPLSLGPLGLRVGCRKQRHVVPPPPAQRGASVLLPVGQRLRQRLPLAFWQQQDGQHGQQGQRRVDHVVQEVAVVVPQVHERGTEAAYAAQGEHDANTAAPAKGTVRRFEHEDWKQRDAAALLICPKDHSAPIQLTAFHTSIYKYKIKVQANKSHKHIKKE